MFNGAMSGAFISKQLRPNNEEKAMKNGLTHKGYDISIQVMDDRHNKESTCRFQSLQTLPRRDTRVE